MKKQGESDHVQKLRLEAFEFLEFTLVKSQARERNTKTNFWVQTPSGGVGIFHVKEWRVQKNICMFLEVQGNKSFGRISRENCRDIPELGLAQKN